MGIWDTISGTTNSLKRNALNPTAVKSWCPTTDSLKRIAPDVTAAKNVYSTAYGYGSATVTKVDGAVRGNLIPYFRNEEAWSKIAQFGAIVAKNATYEGLKLVPGGSTFYNIAASSIRDFNNSNEQEVDVKALQAELLSLKIELSEYRKMNKPCADVKSPSITNVQSVATCKPEDVINVFMMKEFMGRQFCGDLLVPVAPRKRAVTSTRADKTEE
ncbi:hypothetical protein ABKV19_005016 [Rosa sericea]